MSAVELETLLSRLWQQAFLLFEGLPGLEDTDASAIAAEAESAARCAILERVSLPAYGMPAEGIETEREV